MTGFVFLRVRAYRLLLAAAALAVLLTTSVLAALTAFSGSIGDAALRHSLTHRSEAAASLVMSAQVTPAQRDTADESARRTARDTFDGLPVTVRTLETSGTYAWPHGLRAAAVQGGDPDLTHLASLDHSRVRLTAGRMPASGSGTAGDPVQVALPGAAARDLGLRPGSPVALTDRLTDEPLHILVTGVYEVSDQTDPYWQLDELGGRGVRTISFTTYGPLLTDPAVIASGRVGSGKLSWLATADFRTVTTDRMDALHSAATAAPKKLKAAAGFGTGATARTSLPQVLEQIDRALLVSRSTLMIVAVQLVMLAGYALLLVARLLSSEREGETRLLRARGGSRGRITAFSTIEALLLALPAALLAPLLAGPLTRLLAERSTLSRIGIRLDGSATAAVWLVAAVTALTCALAVVAPALAAGAGERRSRRAVTVPGPVRAGADLGLLAIAAVAYWQLDRQTTGSGSGALSSDRQGGLGIDPLLVAAPALLLLAGTVLTLRLLPPAARLAERRAAGGRGLVTALAGWQFSRRLLRNAAPVLLLILAVAMGMLAVGQRASWDRSQSDQADFRVGASLRVQEIAGDDPTKAGGYAQLPGVRDAAPAVRTTLGLSGDRTAEVLVLDTAHAGQRMLMREDLGDQPQQRLFDSLAPQGTTRAGLVLPKNSEQVRFDVRITAEGAPRSPSGTTPRLTVLLEDRYGLSYRVAAGTVPVDGKAHPLGFAVAAAGDLAVTGFELGGGQPAGRSESHRFAVSALRTVTADRGEQPVPVPDGFAWDATSAASDSGTTRPDRQVRATASAQTPLAFTYATGSAADADARELTPDFSVRAAASRPEAPAPNAVASDAYLKAAGAKVGQTVDVTLARETVRVKIVKSVRRLPTTGIGAVDAGDAGDTGTTAGRARDGGALLLDLRAVGQALAHRPNAVLTPTEWWLSTTPGQTGKVAAALRARPDSDPTQVQVRDEVAQELVGDPLGAGPQAALPAVAVVAAALAAVGFAVSAVGAQRERSAELAVLRALGTPRRRLTRMIAAEQGVLIAIALLVGTVLGAVLVRGVVPLIVLTEQATAPVPPVLVQLPAGQLAALLASVAALPLLIVAFLALRGADPATSLRHQGDH